MRITGWGADAHYNLGAGQTTVGVDLPGQWKQPVVAATTGAITIATGLNAGDSIDGVTLADGDRVLVKDQGGGGVENGIYEAGASPARALDLDDDAEVLGAVVYVIGGTANAGTAWHVSNTAATVVGTDPIAFARLGASLEVAEADGTPDVTGVNKIVVPNGSLTNDGGGQVTLAFAGHGPAVFAFDGGGGAVPTASQWTVYFPSGGAPSTWTLIADGTITVDLWKCTYAAYDDTTHPVAGDSMCGGSPPAIASGVKATGSAAGFSAISAGDVVRADVSAGTATWCQLTLEYS